MKHFWFKPKRYWRWFAAYYPVSWEGWLVTLIAAGALAKLFFAIDATSHSASDTLIGMAPWAICILLAFDLVSFRTGEYPSWWKRRS